MPMRCVPPEVFLEYKGVKVYYTYRGGCVRTFWFTLDEDEEEENEFDVRDLETWVSSGKQAQDIHRTIMDAIDQGILVAVE